MRRCPGPFRFANEMGRLCKKFGVDSHQLMEVFTKDQKLKAHLEEALRLIMRGGRRNVGVVGLSFKPGTDDLRESPLVVLVERLIGRGFPVKVYDENVQLSRIFGVGHKRVDLSGCRLDGKEVIELERTGQSTGQARFEGLCW